MIQSFAELKGWAIIHCVVVVTTRDPFIYSQPCDPAALSTSFSDRIVFSVVWFVRAQDVFSFSVYATRRNVNNSS